MLKALCPLIFAQLLADTATSGQPSANPAPALCRLWWDSGTVRAAAERWAGRVEGIRLTKAWLGGKANLPFSTAWKTFAATSALLGTPAPQKKRISGLQHAPVLPCCLTSMHTKHNTLDTLLLSQLSSDILHAHVSNPPPHKLIPAGFPLWCTQNRQTSCLSVSFHNAVCGRAD